MSEKSVTQSQLLDQIELCLDQNAAMAKQIKALHERVEELENVIYAPVDEDSDAHETESSDGSEEITISLGSDSTSDADEKKKKHAPKREWAQAYKVKVDLSSDEDSLKSPPSPKPVAPLKRSASLRAPARLSSIAADTGSVKKSRK